MKLSTVRTFALSLPEVTEAPHHTFGSLRVRDRIFVTLLPGDEVIHVFLGDDEREQALAMYPDVTEKLMWGRKALGVRVARRHGSAAAVKRLGLQAWRHKAPEEVGGGR